MLPATYRNKAQWQPLTMVLSALFLFSSATEVLSPPTTDVTSGTWVSGMKEPQQEQEHFRRNWLRSERNRGSPRSLNKDDMQ